MPTTPDPTANTEPLTRNNGVTMPNTSRARLWLCTITKAIGSDRGAGPAMAYVSDCAPLVETTTEASPSSVCTHCQLSVHPWGRFCDNPPGPLVTAMTQFGNDGVGNPAGALVKVGVAVTVGVAGVGVAVAVPVGVTAVQLPPAQPALKTTVQPVPHKPMTGAPQDGNMVPPH
jgi:hypothetical protein